MCTNAYQPTLLPKLREEELADHVRVMTRYRDLTGDPYETLWDIEPAVYEGIRSVGRKNMTDLVDTLQRSPESRLEAAARQEDARDGRDTRSEDTNS